MADDATTYMTTEEVAELCRTSPQAVRYWAHSGRGPASFKLGRRNLYVRADVLAWIAKQRQAARAAS